MAHSMDVSQAFSPGTLLSAQRIYEQIAMLAGK